jgi:iron complex transport system ATP-binding protein
VLCEIDWKVDRNERWVVLGPNGSGKTTLLSLVCGFLFPAQGSVDVLGERLGRVDVRQLRGRIGLTSAELAKQLRPDLPAYDAVLSGRHAALETWWHDYEAADRGRARELLGAAGLSDLADHAFSTLSEGERQQVQLARTLMGDPELLLLDEPNAGLDLAARERLLTRLSALADSPQSPPMILVTHHLEEIPAGFSHVLLLRSGRVVAQGRLEQVLDSATVSSCFGLDLEVVRHGRRWACHAVG